MMNDDMTNPNPMPETPAEPTPAPSEGGEPQQA
jgi:hypothetical protein